MTTLAQSNHFIVNQSPSAVYVHVPFCHSRCPYCNFTLVANRADWIDRYLVAIDLELKRSMILKEGDGKPKIKTLFLGGGTPSLLDDRQLGRLTDSLLKCFELTEEYEWSIEANPTDLTATKCNFLRSIGINRVSIGGQSFDERKLAVLGRDHNPFQLRDAIQNSLATFDNVSVDLIFGTPKETLSTWQLDLDQAIASNCQHVSTYGLTFEKGAAFWGQLQKGIITAVAEDDELDMYRCAIESLTSDGFLHYEVSNFGRLGRECKHNQVYWLGEPWYAFGPGAAGFRDSVRYVNHRSTARYLQLIEQGQSAIAESDSLDWVRWTRERFVFGMRLLSGVEWSDFSCVGEPKTIESIWEIVECQIESGLMEEVNGCVRLTRNGLYLADSVLQKYW